jgi:hypothetical protein
MRDLLRRSWQFILGKLSTSALSLVLFSIVIPVAVFCITAVHAWRSSGGKVPLGTFIAGVVEPTALTIGLTLFALLCLMGWGVIVTLRSDWASLKETIAQRDREIAQLKANTGSLKIHSAWYGTSTLDEISVTEELQSSSRDGLVIRVGNNLIPGRPDPAPGEYKRLVVRYSFGNSEEQVVEKPESRPSAPVWLVLPEESLFQKPLIGTQQSVLPERRPIVVPTRYGRIQSGPEAGHSGLSLRNDGEPAYNVSASGELPIPNVGKVVVWGTPQHLRQGDPDLAFPLLLETVGGNSPGGQLYYFMVEHQLDEITIPVIYRDADENWFQTDARIIKEQMARAGIGHDSGIRLDWTQKRIPQPKQP